jgi:predicted AAA+ superfamily ATPase
LADSQLVDLLAGLPAIVVTGEPRLHHLRHEGGDREVDLIAELSDGRIIAFEVKASSSPKPADARHLAWLKERLGDQVVAAVLLHTGPQAFTLANGIRALPISCIWAPEV